MHLILKFLGVVYCDYVHQNHLNCKFLSVIIMYVTYMYIIITLKNLQLFIYTCMSPFVTIVKFAVGQSLLEFLMIIETRKEEETEETAQL